MCPSAPLVWKRKSNIQTASSSSSSSSSVVGGGGGSSSSGNNDSSDNRRKKATGDVTPSLMEKLLSAWK